MKVGSGEGVPGMPTRELPTERLYVGDTLSFVVGDSPSVAVKWMPWKGSETGSQETRIEAKAIGQSHPSAQEGGKWSQR